ncbi:MAG TPA: 50S ribosomal protein L11 methyltransferase [Pyrinomonadaceae bacterium]|nr:50S ribosomal protein L11 methyltransferase [Pyrinomonadaceae bacterium]
MKIWSDTEYVYRCLADEQRTLAFKAAIEAVVKPGSVVLDLGTGSGIMSVFAARCGARKVYAIEVGKYLSRVSKKIFSESEFADRIVPLQLEASNLNLTLVEKPDVVICEQITTGLIGEPQGPVINALKLSGIVDANTTLIPAQFSTTVALVHADFTFYGAELKFPIFVDYFTKSFESRYESLSEQKAAHTVDFAKPYDERVVIKELVHSSEAGIVNGILLTSFTRFAGDGELGACISYAQPVILPVDELEITKGATVAVALNYEMGQGFDSLDYHVGPASETAHQI